MFNVLKQTALITLVFATALSCKKESNESEIQINGDIPETNVFSMPKEFNSEADLISTIESYIDGTKTKSSDDGFVSYYQTVMQEDGYDDRQNAIFSEALGSLLNPNGEVIFGNTLMKVGKTGVFYGPVSEAFEIRQLAESSEPLSDLFERETKASLYDDVLLYWFIPNRNIYMCDTFGLYSGNSEQVANDFVSTKADVITWSKQGKKEGGEMDNEYVWPKGGDQKNRFNSDSKVANDTKIYKQDFGVYKEAGVKTKTMKKHGVFWKKFTAEVTSAVTSVMITEGGLAAATEAPTGWLDVNKTNYSGRSFIIATKVVNSYRDIHAGGTATDSECNAAQKWAKNNGVTVPPIEGIRYVIKEDPKNCIVHLKDIVQHYTDSKNTLIFNLKTSETKFDTDEGFFKNLKIDYSHYRVDIMFLYGYSKYNGEIKGSILHCGRFGVPDIK